MFVATCRKLIISLYCCFLLLSERSFAKAEQTPYTIQHYTDEDGLPQNSVKFIVPDEYGFMWMATEDGLVRFDGKQFLVFNNSNLGIQNSRIQFIFPPSKNRSLLVRTIREEEITVHNGKALVGRRRSGDFAYIFNNDTSRGYPVMGCLNSLENVEANHYLVPLEADAYFRITRDTIRFIKAKTEQYRIRYPGINPAKLFVLSGRLCYMDRNGQFILFDRNGAHALRLDGNPPQLRTSSNVGEQRLLFRNFEAGQQFIYAGQSCFRLQLLNEAIIRATPVLSGFDFNSNDIVAIYQDIQYQRLFLGSRTKGLFICEQQQFGVVRSGQKGNQVFYAQAPLGADSIVTPGGDIFSRATAVGRLALPDTLWTGDKYSMTRDNNGNYWYKAYNKLFKLNRDLTKILWSTRIDKKITGTYDEIAQLYADKAGRLWIGTWNSGLYFLETSDPHPRIQLFSVAVKDISYMLEDRQSLWVGTWKGLYRIDLLSRRIDTINGLADLYIRSLYIPRSGEVWITTYANGIFLYRNGHLTNLPIDPKKYMATAHCVIADNQGYLWVTTNKGLFQLSYNDVMEYEKGARNELFYLYYGKDQGFNTNEFNGGCQPCALKLRNGDISLPSLDGLVYFSPEGIRQELPDRQIFIDAVELDAKTIDVDSSITLPNDFQHLRLYVSTPYFGDHNNLRLYYSLSAEGAGSQELWLRVNDNRSIEFSSLNSGKHILKIRKITGFGAGKTMERRFVINVQKAFYETVWFRLLATVIMVLLAFGVFLLMVERVKRKNRILEAHVMERTSELKETLDNLQLSEQQLRRQGFIQQRLTAAMSHDLKTPLKYMMQVLRKGAGDKVEIEKDERKVIYESLYNMFHLVENLISYMRSQYIGDDSSLEITDLYYLLEEKAGIFRSISEAKEVSIVNDTRPGSLVLVNRQLLAIVVHNLLDNAVKYTRKGYVRLQASSDEENIYIRISDTGIGMPEALSVWMNQNRNGMSIAEGKPHSYDGIGLLIVIELLQLINGSIVVSPNDGNGTIIDVTLAVVK
jgi:ligand-binding sensor domain-containing protein/signal transduction histidine kinase